MSLIHIVSPPNYSRERAYTYDTLFRDFLGLTYDSEVRDDALSVTISIQRETSLGLLSVPDILFQTPASNWLKPESSPRLPLSRKTVPIEFEKEISLSHSVPIVFGSSDSKAPLIKKTCDGLTLSVDIFGGAFFLLTRLEELISSARDSHERFPASHSILCQENLLERPVVNEYTELLWGALRILAPDIRRQNRSPRIFVSHDVDCPWVVHKRNSPWVLRSVLVDLILRHDLQLAGKRARALLASDETQCDLDPANTFDLLMDLSEEAGLKSAFYFICGSKNSSLDANYDMSNAWIRSLLKKIHRRGHEIGIHGSYQTFDDQEQFSAEFKQLKSTCREIGIEQEAWGGRQHYLRWNASNTWQIWENAGMDYDSSLGFPDAPGFRCGTCYEFQTFNVQTRQALRLRERPLLVMDTTLLETSSTKRFENAVSRIHLICQKYQGDFSLLCHNSNLMGTLERSAYRRIVREFRAKGDR